MAFYYSRDSWQALKSIPWSGKYVFDDEIIRYISIESRKANFPTVTVDGGNNYDDNGSEHGPSILVHTSVPFGINNKDVDEAIVYEMILKHLNLVLPNLGNYPVLIHHCFHSEIISICFSNFIDYFLNFYSMTYISLSFLPQHLTSISSHSMKLHNFLNFTFLTLSL